ncbi:MAG: TRASH domain-containing protein [Candidatus Lokiarchaeota archaeon]|nr:TRASH domain-containing protein [Candidatus Lokiarchaeota archaeon]MBD3202010.1 TRASH domain-containing protein [Candidatus Lokiarchaeota archaeon]
MKCSNCGKEIIKDEAIQHFKKKEPTTILFFCSESCQQKWKFKNE